VTTTVTVDRLGHGGDGIADTPDGPLFIAYTLPGETVRATRSGPRASLDAVVTPSPDRATPICRHFTVCGGCTTQHLSRAAYIAWKTGILTGALAQHGVTAKIAPLVTAPPRARRRAILGAARGADGIVIGYHEPRGHRLVDLAECPVLMPEIADRLPGLRALVAPLLGAGAPRGAGLRVTVTATDTGLDVVVEGAGHAPTPAQREALSHAATAAGIARVTLDRDPIHLAATPTLRFGTVNVVPPPGVFLQAVPAIERAMAAAIVAALGRAKRVADLFCGLGTFTFPIAARAEVTAVDSDRRAIAALTEATRRGQGIRPVTALARDLYRDPFAPRELDAFDAVVLDPPRAGAADQAARLARSKVATVVMVSCAPGTLARDLATLVAGGYGVVGITPFDQFVDSPHLETVTLLRRGR
jgi:23S rRNA (uracil1939-C5)-methyltransferase